MRNDAVTGTSTDDSDGRILTAGTGGEEGYIALNLRLCISVDEAIDITNFIDDLGYTGVAEQMREELKQVVPARVWNWRAAVDEFGEPDPEQTAPAPYGINEGAADPGQPRWLLVEANARGGSPSVYYTLHHSPDDAADYHLNQEYPDDWTVEALINLETGTRFDPEPTTVTTIHWSER